MPTGGAATHAATADTKDLDGAIHPDDAASHRGHEGPPQQSSDAAAVSAMDGESQHVEHIEDAALEHPHDAGFAHHPCAKPYFVDPRDNSASGERVRLVTAAGNPTDPSDDQYDLQIPADIKAWLEEQRWVREHANWHNVRRWDDGKNPAILVARGLSPAPILEGQPGDGLSFLAMHRHMLQGLRQAFPRHFLAIRAFAHVPRAQSDADNPFPWKDIEWSDSQLQTLDILEHIEQHVDDFESDDDFGNWLQFLRIVPPEAGPDGTRPDPAESALGGIHLSLHAQFAVPDSPFSLLDNEVNLYLVPFWQLHGWLDNVWARFRLAKGLRDDDPAYQAELLAQCEEMHRLDDQRTETATPDAGMQVVEKGEFASKVAPILQTYCRGCHAVGTTQAGLALTGLPASEVRKNLVNVHASEVDMALVEPGAPQRSWLMRKLTADFTDIDCGSCKTSMPLAGAKPSAAELAIIRAWITAGATGG